MGPAIHKQIQKYFIAPLAKKTTKTRQQKASASSSFRPRPVQPSNHPTSRPASRNPLQRTLDILVGIA